MSKSDWRVVREYPWLLVSDKGKVISLARSCVRTLRNGEEKWQSYKEMELSQRNIGAGYRAIGTKVNGRQRTLYVHRLVAAAFIDKPEGRDEVNHLDGDKTNNSVSNLEWVTRRENQVHMAKRGTTRRKLTEVQVISIRKMLQNNVEPRVIAETFGVSVSAVRHIEARRAWAWV
jgi:DNA-binding transcriptional regulator YiaG